MHNEFKRNIQIILIVLDILFLNISLAISIYIFKIHLNDPAFFLFIIYLSFLWIVISFLNGTYFEKSILHFETFTKQSIQVYLFWIIIALLSLILISSLERLNRFFLLGFLLWGFFLLVNRFIYLGIRNRYKDYKNIFKSILILGYNDTALKLASYFDQELISIDLKGFVEDKSNINELSPYPVLSDIEDVIAIAKKLHVEEIYSTLPPDQISLINKLIDDAEKNCIRIKIVPDLSYFFEKPFVVRYLRDLPILSPRSEPLEDIGNQIKKRILDLFVSTIVIIFILIWLIPLIGLLIILESKGPVFFVQERTGKNNSTFKCLKFRSMYVNKLSDIAQAKKNDSRVTKIGKILRKSSLDEFPQFINVFMGQMSLVGPRPHMLKHTDEYSRIVNRFMIRHFSKPGITGWAQINGFRGEVSDFRQIKLRVENDIWYLENWNVWLDIKIIFLTIFKIFKGDKNAY